MARPARSSGLRLFPRYRRQDCISKGLLGQAFVLGAARVAATAAIGVRRPTASCTMNPAQRQISWVPRRGMKWVSGDPVEVTDEDFKLIHTTLSAWARARGSTVVYF